MDGNCLSVMTQSPKPSTFYPCPGLRHSGVEAPSGRALPGVRFVHRRLLPHPRHRNQLQGQRLLRQGGRIYNHFTYNILVEHKVLMSEHEFDSDESTFYWKCEAQ